MPPVAKINFLSIKLLRVRRQARRLLALQTPAIVLVAFNVLLVIALLLYSFFLRYQLNLWKEREKTILSEIKDLSSLETKHVFIKGKLASLVSIFESSQKHQDLTDAILSLLPTGVMIQGLVIDDGGNISFRAEAKSFKALKDLLANVRQGEVNPPTVKIQFAEVNGVELESDGGYSLKIIMRMESLPIL